MPAVLRPSASKFKYTAFLSMSGPMTAMDALLADARAAGVGEVQCAGVIGRTGVGSDVVVVRAGQRRVVVEPRRVVREIRVRRDELRGQVHAQERAAQGVEVEGLPPRLLSFGTAQTGAEAVDDLLPAGGGGVEGDGGRGGGGLGMGKRRCREETASREGTDQWWIRGEFHGTGGMRMDVCSIPRAS